MLTRTSTLIGAYRPELSYQAAANLSKMRYFSVDTIVVRAGHVGEFVERWEAIVAAHTKAKLDEHWAVYQSRREARRARSSFSTQWTRSRPWTPRGRSTGTPRTGRQSAKTAGRRMRT